MLLRARVIGGLPGDLVGSLTGLTQGRFPVHAKATYAGQLDQEGQQAQDRGNAAVVVESDGARRGIDIFARKGAPAIAVNDGKIVAIGKPKRLGSFVKLLDVYGNTYTYAHLGKVAKTYPAPKERSSATARRRADARRRAEPAKAAPKTRCRAARPTAARRRRRPPRRCPAKERLFAHPERPDARVAGGDAQLGDADDRRPAEAAPLGFDAATSSPSRSARAPA